MWQLRLLGEVLNLDIFTCQLTHPVHNGHVIQSPISKHLTPHTFIQLPSLQEL